MTKVLVVEVSGALFFTPDANLGGTYVTEQFEFTRVLFSVDIAMGHYLLDNEIEKLIREELGTDVSTLLNKIDIRTVSQKFSKLREW